MAKRKRRPTTAGLLAAIESGHGRACPDDLAKALRCDRNDLIPLLEELESAGLAAHEGVMYDNPWHTTGKRPP